MAVPTLSLLYIIVRFTIFAAGCALLVMGVLITVNKEKQTKILGIEFILSGAASAISGLFTTFRYLMGAAIYAKLSIGLNLVSMLVNIATMFCICWYIHKTYGKKYIYIPIFAIMAVNRIASTVVSVCLNKTGNGMLTAYWISLTTSINGFVSGTAIAVILILAFYQNRDKEKIIPDTWKIRIAVYAVSLLKTGYYVFAYVLMLKVVKDHSFDPGGLINFLYGNGEAIVMLIDLIAAFAALIFPVYVFIRLKKAKAQKTAEPEEIETAP